jgi:uncharacterized protein (DUF433 family)
MTGGSPKKPGSSGHGQVIGPPSDPHYTAPLYKKVEAARIIDVPASTLRNWADGSVFSSNAPTAGTERDGLITVVPPATPRGPTIPFIGLTEAYVLASFRGAGVPMQRIRPAIRRLEQEIRLTQALASERLQTDGAEVLYDYGQHTEDPAEKDAVSDLVVVRNGQRVFRPIVRDYLRRVTYHDGWARIINVGRGKIDVTVDPWINGGHPTVARRGIAAADVLSRIRAGESSRSVAADYGLRISEVTSLLELAA